MATGNGLNSIGSKGVNNTSDGVGPQMQPNESRQLRTTTICGNSPFDSSIYKQPEAQERVRNFDQSDSDFTEEEYQLPPQPWRGHRENN